MTAFKPQYRATVFVPKSAQPDPSNETEVLYPILGASHSDPFQVSTAEVAGFKPYLQIPSGRKGRVDFKTKNTDKGSLTLTLLDRRISDASGNLERWLTAFMGDAGGKTALLKCLVRVEESLDNGTTWAPFFTGRIEDVKQKSKIEFTLALKDLSEDLDQRIFLGDVEPPTITLDAPSQVPYAKRQPLVPYGLRAEWGDLNAVTPRGIDGSVVEGSADFLFRIRSTPGNDSRRYQLLTDELRNLASERSFAGGVTSLRFFYMYETGSVRVAVYNSSGVFHGWYWLRALEVHVNEEKHVAIDSVFCDEAPEFGTFGSPGSGAVRWELFKHGPLTEGSAVLVDDVHAVQFMKDLFLGYFGIRNDDGSPRYGVPIDEASFDALIADTSFPMWRGIVSEAGNLREFVQEKICQPCQVAYALDASGAVKAIDMRRATEAASYPEIDDGDLISSPDAALATWVAADAITHVTAARAKYRQIDVNEEIYREDAEFGTYPDVPAAALEISEEEAQFFALGDVRTLDFGRKSFEIDTGGLYLPVRTIQDIFDVIFRRWRLLDRVVEDLFAMFSHGAGYFTLKCRRSGMGEATQVGDRRLVTCSALPDPVTNLRGGTRIAVCIERSEDASVVTLGFVDLGANEAAEVPDSGTPIPDPDPDLCRHWLTVPVTLNADGDPVRIEVAIVDVGDAQPAAGSSLWQFYKTQTTSAPDVVLGPFPSGRRVYIRMRSFPLASSGLKLPSAWIFPDPAFVDMCALGGPIACLITTTNGVRLLTWTNTNDDLPIRVTLDGAPVAHLPAGSTSYPLNALPGPGSVAIMYVEPEGGISTSCEVDYTIVATVQAPRPAGLDVLQPSSILLGLFPANHPDFPGVYFWWKIERALDDGAGAPDLGTIEVIADDLDLGPGTKVYPDPQPFGSARFWYRAYHVLPGFLDSEPTIWDSGVPTPGDPPDPSPVMPTIEEVVTETETLGTLRLIITDPQGRLISVEFKSRSGDNPETAYAIATEVAPGEYEATVAIEPGKSSTISYRVTAYDADGVPRVIATNTVRFGGGGQVPDASFVTAVGEPELPNHRVLTGGVGIIVTDDPEGQTITVAADPDFGNNGPGNGETVVELTLWASNLTKAWGAWPEEVSAITAVPVTQTHYPLVNFRFARLVAVVEQTNLPDLAAVAVQYETDEPDVWEFLDLIGGPFFRLDSTIPVLNKAVPGEYVEIDLAVRRDVRLRLVAMNGDGDPAKFVIAPKFVLQLVPYTDEDEPPETEPPYTPPDPGSCDVPSVIDAFGYANVAALDAAWPED